MFDTLRLLEPNRRDIILHTRKRREIPNEIGLDPTPQHLLKFAELVKKNPTWVVRKPPTGGYNCAGHVFASRRTGVYDDFDNAIGSILADDGYRCLGREAAHASAAHGDLVLYWMSVQPRTNLLHVGVVSELRPGITTESPRVPWVLSKWDDTSGEVLHHYNFVPFESLGYVVEFWTDRPDPSGAAP